MNSTDENMTPGKEEPFDKRPKLKRIKKKKTKFDLNASTNNKLFTSFQSRMNISAANSSVVKASLRANNKALAQSLEKVRQDLRVSYEVNNDMKKEIQDLQLRLMNLERVAGLKDEGLEKEVQRRIEDKTKQLKMILSSVSVHLLDAGSCLQDALDKCIDPTRLSVASSARHSSLGTSDDACSPLNSAATSSAYFNPNTFSRVANLDPKLLSESEPIPVEEVDPPESMISQQQLQEMTMILEQSVLAEVEDLPEVTEAVEGNGGETGDDLISVTEREVLPKITKKESITSRRSSGKRKDQLNSDLEINKSPNISSYKVNKEKQDHRRTFVVPSPAQQEETKPSEDKVLQNRRGTFVLSKPAPQEKISKRAIKRETVVLKSSAVLDPPMESKEEEKSLFKAPFPVVIGSKDQPMDAVDDVTVYLNTDMELTEVIPVGELAALTADMDDKEDQTVDDKKTDKHIVNREQIKEKSVTKVGKSSSLTAISGKEKKNFMGSKSDTDISKDKDDSAKSAVVLQLRKPGKIVFSAARKEYDGSRKALPSKLPTRPRSKSKKAMREVKESVAADTSEPKTIFDFHDKTPVHLTEKSRIEPSVYDLSGNESQTQSSADHVAGKYVTLKAKEKKLEIKGKVDTKCDLVSITYTMPLKGSPEESKPKDRDRSRSRSRARSKTATQSSDVEDETGGKEESKRGRSKGGQGRSKSRTRKKEDSDKDWEMDEPKARVRSKSRAQQTRSRSQSRKRLADNERDEDETEPEEEVVIDRKSRSRRRKKVTSYAEEEDEAELSDDTQKSIPETVKENGIAASTTDERQTCLSKKTSANKSEKNVPDNSDDDFKVSVTHRKSVSSKSGRSKCQKQLESDNEVENDGEKPSKSINSDRSDDSTTSDGRPGRGSNKTTSVHSNSNDEAAKGERMDYEDAEDNIVLDDSFKTDNLEPISSVDFISRISSTRQKSSAEDSNEEESKDPKLSSKNKIKIGPLQSEEDNEEVTVVPVRNARTKDKKKTEKVASAATDDEVEDEDQGNKTEVVPATDDEGHSEEDISMAAGTTQNDKNTVKAAGTPNSKTDTIKATKRVHSKDNTNESARNSTRKGPVTAIDSVEGIAQTKNETKECSKKINNTKSKDVSDLKTDAFSVPLKESPGPPRGRSRVLKKVERSRSRSRKRGNVQDILLAFKEADDPDHSLRLNAVSRNDSVVIAEVIKNACLVGDVEGEKFEKLCEEALEETHHGEIYSLPLKDSPKESSKAKGRARSQSRSRGRSRSKKRVLDTDDEDFVPPKPSKATTKLKNEETEVIKTDEESRTYTLPLKGSPDEPKKYSRSRSQSRPRAGQRGRSQSRKRVDAKGESPERCKPKDTAAKEDLKITFDAESPIKVRSRSVKKIKQKNLEEKITESNQFTPEKKNKSRRKVLTEDESASDQKFSPIESLNVTFDAESPSDAGKRSVKKVKSKQCENEDKEKEQADTKDIEKSTEEKESNPSEKSTGKKSIKKKKTDDSVRKSQQAELKERFNELKRKLSMMPKPSDRTSSVSAEKENDGNVLKRKRESSEDNSEVMVEKRSRRAAAAAISYKEPSCTSKLRRGDPGTSHFFSATDPLKIFKSPGKSGKGKDHFPQRNGPTGLEGAGINQSSYLHDRLSEDMLGKAVLDNISNTVTTKDD